MQKNHEYLSRIAKLNSRQREAVESIEGPVMVIAGPGTGKTQIITLRIANILLRTQVNPNNILALTFTEQAATEMRQRLVHLIGTDAYKVHIHTFHAFCNELIQKNVNEFHHLLSYEPIDELTQIEIIKDFIDSNTFQFLRPHGDPSHYFHPALTAISMLKKEGVSPEKYQKSVQLWKENFESRDDLKHTKGKYKGKMKGTAIDELRHIQQSEEFAQVYLHYQRIIREKKLYDYEDMILEVLSEFGRNEEFLATMRETYQYILVDEHQDTNDAQNRIIESLCGHDNTPNLFVVGDEKQSIFRFQGASLENFLYFQKLYPSARLIHLEDNYRSSQSILDGAFDFIQNNPKSISSNTQLHAKAQTSNNKIQIHQYNSAIQEQSAIADMIQKFHKQGMQFNEIAVLYRKNQDLTNLAQVFDQKGIPYHLSTHESIFSDYFIQKILLLLRAIHSLGDDIPFSRIFLMDIFNVNPLEYFDVQRQSTTQKISLWEMVKNKTLPSAMQHVGDQIIQWKLRAENNPFNVFFLEVLHESHLYTQIMKQSNAFIVMQKLSVMYADIQDLQRKNHKARLDDYIKHLDLMEQHKVEPHSSTPNIISDRVLISTVHKSKGLEFNCVFIPNIVDGYWGGGRSRGSLLRIPWKYISRTQTPHIPLGEIEEERRLFYVAMTRAKSHLILSYSNQDATGKSTLPSQFLNELPKSILETTIHGETEGEAVKRIASQLSPSSNQLKPYLLKDIQNYIMDRFTSNGLSVSALNNFTSCPWKYVFRNLIRIPDVKGYYLLLGTVVHSGIREYIVQLKKGRKLSTVELTSFLNSSIDRYSANDRDIEQLKSKGSLIISSYLEQRMSTWNTLREAEVIVPNIFLTDGVFINGKIDMIEFNKDKTVNVYDFKTGKTRSRNDILGLTKQADKSYFRQLTFYKLLLDVYKKGTYRMKHGIIEFVESGVEGAIRQEVFEISNEDVAEVKNEIVKMRDSLAKLSFWNSQCEDKDCEYCKYQPYITQLTARF